MVSFPHREPEPDADAFLGEVLAGWARAQRSRSLRDHHISVGRRNVMHLADFSGKFPREWLPADADEWFAHLRAVKNLTHATLRLRALATPCRQQAPGPDAITDSDVLPAETPESLGAMAMPEVFSLPIRGPILGPCAGKWLWSLFWPSR